MSATLHIAVSKTLVGGDARVGAVADVLPILPETGTLLRGVVVPVGHGPERTTVTVEPGRYVVLAHLPSGELVSRQVTLAASEEVDLLLQPERSPHEWLGWSHLVSPVRRALRPVKTTAEAHTTPTLHLLEHRHRPGPASAGGQWEALAHLLGSRSRVGEADCAAVLGAEAGGQRVDAAFDDGESRSFALPDGLYMYARWYAVVERGARSDLVALALPWMIFRRGGGPLGDAAVDLVVHSGEPGSIGVVVKDPERGALLGYLANGALPTARRMLGPDAQVWTMALDGLYGKRTNPYAAAASALVLVQSESAEQDQEWEPWLDNLANQFEWLPDGAVLLASRHLGRARTPADVARTRELFEEAVQRGLPVYTATLRLLLDGMTTLVGDPDADAGSLETMLPFVRAVARHVDMREPFTTIRFGGRQ